MATASASPRNSIWKVLLPIAAIILLAFGALHALKSQITVRGEKQSAQIKVGEILPDFVLPRLSGGEVRASELGARVMLINFWATWCDACMIEMPSIQKLWESYRDRGLQVIAINVDEKPETVIPKAINQLGISFPMYVDRGMKLSEFFDVHAIPLTVIVGKDNRIVFIESGERDWNGSDIRDRVEVWLKE